MTIRESLEELKDLVEGEVGEAELEEAGGRMVLQKDLDRMIGIVKRAGGSPSKAERLAGNMARSIRDKDKAIRRGQAALQAPAMKGALGKAVAKAFFQRAVDLGSSGAKRLLDKLTGPKLGREFAAARDAMIKLRRKSEKGDIAFVTAMIRKADDLLGQALMAADDEGMLE